MKVIDFIVADDIRTEQGNKYSVMGIYSDCITMSVPAEVKWPIGFRFASFVRLELGRGDPDALRFEFKIFSGDRDVAGFAGAVVKAPDTNIVTLPLVVSFLPLAGAGELHFRFRVLDDAGQELLSENLRALRVVVTPAKV